MAFELRHALDAQQRVAAEVEEVVVDAHAVDAEQVGPHVREGLLHAGRRCGEGHIEVGALHVRCGQSLAVDLAAGGAGQFLHGHKGGGLHVIGQEGGEVLTDLVGAELDLRDVVADQAFQARPVLTHVGHGLLHRRVLLHGHFHFTQFDAVAAHLYLAIDTALVIDLAVRQFRCSISGAIHPATVDERIREKTLGRKVVATDIAFGHTCAAEIEFTFFALFHRLHLLIEHVQLHVVDGAADVGQGGPGGWITFQLELAHHVTFGGAVLVAEAATGQLLEEVRDGGRDLQLLAAGEDFFQRRRDFTGALHGLGQVLQRHEGHDDAVDLLRDDLAKELRAVQAVLVGDQHQGAALCERGEDLLEAHIEADGSELQRAITLFANAGAQLPLDQVRQRCMVHGHALGPAGASAGEEHVEQVVGFRRARTLEHRTVLHVDLFDQ